LKSSTTLVYVDKQYRANILRQGTQLEEVTEWLPRLLANAGLPQLSQHMEEAKRQAAE